MKKLLSIIILSFLWSNSSQALSDCKGEDYKKWKNCIGTANIEENLYKGKFGDEPGILNGVAIYKYNNGDSYIGEVKQGTPSGLGIRKFKDGGYYIGQYLNNESSGWGIYYFKSNNKYVLGQVKDNAINGFATSVDKLDMLSLQRGIFKDFNYRKSSKSIEPQCKGSYINPRDSKDWTNCRGVFDTSGIFYDSDFKNGVPNGIAWVRLFEGELSKALGHKPSTYVGELKISKDTGWGERTGMGITLFDNHLIQVGSYNNGHYDGKGISVYPNGAIYIGEFKKDKRDGQGDYITIDGTWESGQWKNNKLDGLGMQILPNGLRRTGEFKEDEFVE